MFFPCSSLGSVLPWVLGALTDGSNEGDTTGIFEELRQTVGCRLWLTNLEAPAAITPGCCINPHFLVFHIQMDPTPMTRQQFLDAQLQLEQAHQQRDITQMLKRVVTSMHCLAKFSREAGLTPFVGHAHYIYACFLKSQGMSPSPLPDCNLESVWSFQVDLEKNMPPKACALAVCPHLYDPPTRVASPFMPLEHPRRSRLGCLQTTVVATSIYTPH